MATFTVPHCTLGKTSLAGVSGPALALSRTWRKRNDKMLSDSSSCTTRAVSENFCSTSRGLSQSYSIAKGRGRSVVVGSVAPRSSSPPGVDEFGSGISSFSLSTDGGFDHNFVGRNSGSAINSVAINSEDTTVAEALESLLIGSELTPQALAQGFADSSFVRDFVMDLSVSSVSSTDFESSTMKLFQPRWIPFAKSAEEENMIIDRVINATIVGSAGILAISKMLTVDHDYWRGWTLVEILKHAPVHSWFAYEEMLKSHPIVAKMIISGTVYSIGDWIAQCCEGKNPLEFNRLRMLRSGLVGFCLHGSMSHFYYHFCEWLFPFQGWWVTPVKVAFDQTVWSAVWNSIYFTTIGLLRFETPTKIHKDLRASFVPLITTGWKLWPLAHVVTYGFVPVEQRLLWVDMVEILWVTIMATISNEKSEEKIAEAAEVMKETVIEAAAAQISVDEVLTDESRSSNSEDNQGVMFNNVGGAVKVTWSKN